MVPRSRSRRRHEAGLWAGGGAGGAEDTGPSVSSRRGVELARLGQDRAGMRILRTRLVSHRRARTKRQGLSVCYGQMRMARRATLRPQQRPQRQLSWMADPRPTWHRMRRWRCPSTWASACACVCARALTIHGAAGQLGTAVARAGALQRTWEHSSPTAPRGERRPSIRRWPLPGGCAPWCSGDIVWWGRQARRTRPVSGACGDSRTEPAPGHDGPAGR